MKILLMCLTSGSEPWADFAEEKYVEKINHYSPFAVVHLKPSKISRDDRAKKKSEDSQILLKKIQSDDFVVLFDEVGKRLASLEFAKAIERVQMSGRKRAVFIIGGPFGVDENVKKRADLSISLSAFVLNHLVAKTVALEQLYRAFTIIKGEPYHNQ